MSHHTKLKQQLGEGSVAFIANNRKRDEGCFEAARDYGIGSSETLKPTSENYRENYDRIFRKGSSIPDTSKV